MPTRTTIASGLFSAAGTWDTGVPQAGDHVVVSGGYDIEVAATTNALATFTDAGNGGGSVTVNSGAVLNIDGAATLAGSFSGVGDIACAADLTVGAAATFALGLTLILDGSGNVVWAATGEENVSVEINTAGSVTQNDDVYCGDFTVTTGTLVGTGYTVYCKGDYYGHSNGVYTNVSVNLTGSGTCYHGDYTTPLLLLTCAADGENTEWSGGTTYMVKLVLGPGATSGSGGVYIRFTTVDDALDQDPDNVFVCGTFHHIQLTDVNQKSMNLSGVGAVEFSSGSGGRKLTMTGDLDCGAVPVNISDSAVQQLDMNGHNLTAGAVTYGNAAGANGGTIYGGEGVIKVASMAIAAGNTGTNSFHMEGCTLACSGVFDGDDITVTLDGGNNVIGGTLQNVDVAGVLNCWGVTEGAGNNASLEFRHHGGVEIRTPLAA